MSEAVEPAAEAGRVPVAGWAGEEPLVYELGGGAGDGPREVGFGVPERPLGELLRGVGLRTAPASLDRYVEAATRVAQPVTVGA